MRRLFSLTLTGLTLTAAVFAQTASPDSQKLVLDGIRDLRFDIQNLSWLFGAYGVATILLFGYLFQISRKESNLRRKIGELQEAVEERWKKK